MHGSQLGPRIRFRGEHQSQLCAPGGAEGKVRYGMRVCVCMVGCAREVLLIAHTRSDICR